MNNNLYKNIKKETKQHGRLKTRHIFCFLILAVLFLFFFLYQQALQEPWKMLIKAVNNDELIHSIPVQDEDTFTLSYIHSVSQQPVKGTFKITDEGAIMPLTTEFNSFGPGLPELDSSTTHEITEETIVVYHDEGTRDHIRLFVSPLTQEKIIVHNQELDLYSHQDSPLLIEILIDTGK